MTALPDLEGLAIFAKVAQLRSFAQAAGELDLSKATVSKAISRLETRLGTRLFNRTSRKLVLTDVGQTLLVRAANILAEGEAAESEAATQSVAARGMVRLTVPMSFGVLHVAPLLPAFFRAYPQVSLSLHLNDARIDIVGEGYDAAIRIAAMPDSSLYARRLCGMRLHLVASPAYLKARGRPKHPLELSDHVGLGYSYALAQETWRFHAKNGETAAIRPQGPLRVNNGEAMLPALLAGVGLAVLPEFIAGEALRKKQLEIVLPDWSLSSSAVYWVTPHRGLKLKRVEVLADFFTKQLRRRFGEGG